MGKSKFVMAICAFASLLIFASCTTAPSAPPVNPQSDRAKAIVQGTSTPDFPATPASPGAPLPAQQSPGATAQGIVQQQSSVPQPPAPAPIAQTPASLSSGLTADEQAFLSNYLNRLSYMVYYNDASGMDPRLAKIAVTQANRYLIEKLGLSVIDFDQIEKNKKDQLGAYQAETGGSIGMIQYIAQKLNADVYVEIDMQANGGGYPGSYTGTAQGSMKIFDTSTAILLGSITFLSPATFSPVSMDAAVANAISASVWQAMPKVTEQSKTLLGNSFARGIRYELIVQQIPDARQAAQLIRALSRKFKEVEQLSFSPGETRIAIFAFDTKAKVQESIYDAGPAAMMADMYLLYMRGKSFTFNSGL
jgi:hypothetical protein